MAPRTRTTVLLGDSLAGDGTWGVLAAGSGGEARADVIDLGRAGQTTEDVLALLPEAVSADPGLVVVSAGTHDLGAARRGPEQTVRTLETVLVHLRRSLPGARIVVLSVPPRGRDLADRIRVVNVHIRQFAPTVHAEHVDLWPALCFGDGELNPAFTDDRLHLTADGVAAVREVLLPVLEGGWDDDVEDADDVDAPARRVDAAPA